jgi:cytochrome P450
LKRQFFNTSVCLGLALSLSATPALAAPQEEPSSFIQCVRQSLQSLRGSSQSVPKASYASVASSFVQARGKVTRFLDLLHEKNGPTFSVNAPFGLKKFLFTSDPEVIRSVLADTDRNASSAFIKEPVQIRALKKFSGESTLFTAPYETWRPQRLDFAPAFTPKEVGSANYTARIDEVVSKHLQAIAPEKDLNYQTFLTTTTMDAILQLLFNYKAPAQQLERLADEKARVFDVRLISEAMSPFKKGLHELPNVTPFQRRLKYAYDLTDRLADDILENFEKDPQAAKGFMALLMHASPKAGILTRDEIKQQIKLFIFAGHETTAHTLTWAFHEVLSHPEIKTKLESLIRGGDEKAATEYIDQIWEESLRLHMPVVLLQRSADKATELVSSSGATLKVPQGTSLMLDAITMQRREDLWGAEKTGFPAGEFHPERFSPENRAAHSLTNDDLRTYAFGSGPRICIGAQLAKSEARRIILGFFKHYDANLEASGAVEVSATNGALRSQLITKIKPVSHD